MDAEERVVRARITGRVQGVCYRVLGPSRPKRSG